MYEIIKAMCPPGYHDNAFVGTHALGYEYIMYQVHELPQSHCGDNCEGTLFAWLYIYNIYIYIYIYTYIIYIYIYIKGYI